MVVAIRVMLVSGTDQETMLPEGKMKTSPASSLSLGRSFWRLRVSKTSLLIVSLVEGEAGLEAGPVDTASMLSSGATLLGGSGGTEVCSRLPRPIRRWMTWSVRPVRKGSGM